MSEENASYVVIVVQLCSAPLKASTRRESRQTSGDLSPVISSALLQGNQAESRTADQDSSPADVKEKHPLSQLSDGAEFSIADQSEESASSGDEVDDETAESDLKPYIFSSYGVLHLKANLIACEFV